MNRQSCLRIRRAQLAVVVLILCFSLFGSAHIVSAAKTKLEVWVQTSATYVAAQEALKAAFEKQNPDIEIEYVLVPWAEQSTKVTVALTSGSAPDVINAVEFNVMPFARNGLIEKYPPQLAQRLQRELLPGPRSIVTANGNIYGMPCNLSIGAAPVLTINKTDWDNAGLSTTLRDWADMQAAFRRLTKRDENNALVKAGVSFAFYNPSLFFGSLVLQLGGRHYDDDGLTPLFNSAQGRQALTMMNDMWLAYEWPSQVASTHMFEIGKAAAAWGLGPWYGALRRKTGTIAIDYVQVPPIQPGAAQPWLTDSSWAWWVPAGKGSPEVWRWIEFVMSQESLRTWSLETGEMPAAAALLRQPVVMDRPDMIPFIKSAPWAVSHGYIGSRTQESAIMRTMVTDVLAKGKPIPQGLDEAVTKIKNLTR